MWGIFQRYGRVWEVVIPPRRNKQGYRFDFVRFMNVQEPLRLERELDMILIGSTKLHANLPKYSNDRARQRRQDAGSFRQPDPRKVAKPGGNKPAGSRTGRTFAQVVAGRDNPEKNETVEKVESSLRDGLKETVVEKWNGPDIPQVKTWLKNSLVGVIRNVVQIPSLQDAFILEGYNTIQVRYLGDELVLLTGPEDMNLETALAESEAWVNELFEVVYTRFPAVALDHRVTWLRCSGFSLHMWTPACLEYLVLPIGKMTLIDNATTSLARLDYARIQIRTSHLETINVYKKIQVHGATFTIRINEEVGGDASACCRCVGHETESDDSSSGWSGNGDGDDDVSIFSDIPEERNGKGGERDTGDKMH
ncbi:uncharacterized protein LOC130719283 [Lotus japonicus]|uniref:uncharacterized protein LOC130719283 n=1 Tax=Lotus japonicus TaxID=34305 RepID=UPI00258348A3|nr:uncharacterized protein LOC130719283 [Lotus japonicus]